MNPLQPFARRAVFLRELVCCAAVCCVLLGLGTAAAHAEDGVSLRGPKAAGQSSVYEMRTDTVEMRNTQMGENEASERVEITSETKARWTVESVAADGSSVCRLDVLAIVYQRQAGDGPALRIDSGKAPSDERLGTLYETFRAVTQTPMTVRLEADGSVASLEGYDRMARRAPEAELLPESRRFELLAEQMARLPDAPERTEVGEGWDRAFSAPGETLAPRLSTLHEIDATYTLAELGELEGVPVATVDVERTFEAELDRSEIPDNAPPIRLRVSDVSDTERIYFDLDRGEVAARDGRSAATFTVTIQVPNGGPRIVQTMRTESVSQTLRVEAGGPGEEG
ncbi:MAG: hypothetical protein AAF288_11760 [Planctomycetota bacterium]